MEQWGYESALSIHASVFFRHTAKVWRTSQLFLPPPTHIFYNIEILNDKLVKLPLPAPQIKIMKISEVSGSFFFG